MTQQSGTRRQNVEQERGKQAWEDVREIKNLEDEDREKKYRALARGLNAMIQINGLGQTLGFMYAKGSKDWREKRKKNEHFYLLRHLTHWMHRHFNTAIADSTDAKIDGFLDWITRTATSADYRRATTEVLAFGTWLSRFAEAELKEPENGSKP